MSTQTLLPNAASNGSAFTVTGAGSVEAAVNDTSDSSFVKRTASQYAEQTSWLVLSCSNYTIPAGSKVLAVRAVVKVNVPSGGAIGFGLADASLWQFKASKTVAPIGASVWVNGPWEKSPAGGGAWTQERLDAAAVHFRDYAWDGAAQVSSLREAKLEVKVVGAPTINVTAPTGTQTTPAPTCSWTYTGTDGYQQSAYAVRVFDSATYSAGGFDPETSTPLWSRTGFGTTSSIQLGPLPAAPTQRVYVKVRATSGLWSAWDYEQFTYAVDGPTPPAVSASWSTTNQRATVTVVGRLNELNATSASMETTIGTWVADTNVGSLSRDGFVGGAHGSFAGLVGSTASGVTRVKSGQVGLAASGDVRSGIASFRAWSGTPAARVGIRWIGNGSISWGSSVTTNSTTWTVARIDSAVAPSGTTGWELVLEFTAGSGGDLMYFDKTAAHVNGPAAWGAGGYTLGTQDYVLERSTDAGVTWEVLATGNLDGLQSVTHTDRTARRGGSVRYRARCTADLSGFAVPGEYSSDATITATSDEQVWIRTADGSINLAAVRVLRTLEDDRAMNQGIFDVAPDGDGTAYPVVIEGDLGARTGRWQILTVTQAEHDALVAAVTAQVDLLMQDPYGEQFWVRVTGHSRTTEGDPERRHTLHQVSWVEVA